MNIAVLWIFSTLCDFFILEVNGMLHLFENVRYPAGVDGWFRYYNEYWETESCGSYTSMCDAIDAIRLCLCRRFGTSNLSLINASALDEMLHPATEEEFSSIMKGLNGSMLHLMRELNMEHPIQEICIVDAEEELEIFDEEIPVLFLSEEEEHVQYHMSRGLAWYRHNKRRYYPKKR